MNRRQIFTALLAAPFVRAAAAFAKPARGITITWEGAKIRDVPGWTLLRDGEVVSETITLSREPIDDPVIDWNRQMNVEIMFEPSDPPETFRWDGTGTLVSGAPVVLS